MSNIRTRGTSGERLLSKKYIKQTERSTNVTLPFKTWSMKEDPPSVLVSTNSVCLNKRRRHEWSTPGIRPVSEDVRSQRSRYFLPIIVLKKTLLI